MERFNKQGQVDEKGKFDKEGKDLNFDDKGILIESDPEATLENLQAAADAGRDTKNQLFNEDDDDLFTSTIDDDLFDEVIIDETSEEKEAREGALKLAEEEHVDEDDSDPLEKENTALKARIQQLELNQVPNKPKPLEMPADDETLTVGKMKEVMLAMNQESAQQKTDYQGAYVLSFYKEAFAEGMNQEQADAAFSFLRLPENAQYDKIHSEVLDKVSGSSDGMLNFHRVMRVFNKETKQALPLKHQKTTGQNLNHGKGKLPKTKKVVNVGKLDKASQRFLKSLERKGTPMKEEDITSALSNNSSVHGRGGGYI